MTLAGYSWVVTDLEIGMQTQVEVCSQILQHLETSISHVQTPQKLMCAMVKTLFLFS
jgi:hypothetical protein